MSLFGWSLPAGCGDLPDEQEIAPICENCPEEILEKCPREDYCFRFLYFLRKETFYPIECFREY
ncbi:MAG: hypothetical protein FP814_09615 [Desulfobacterium sp.]|nr:hypothetical protein [Desulfobacterium sp.]